MRKRNLLIAGVSGIVVTAGSVTLGATAFAAPNPTVVKACVTNSTGVMHQVS